MKVKKIKIDTSRPIAIYSDSKQFAKLGQPRSVKSREVMEISKESFQAAKNGKQSEEIVVPRILRLKEGDPDFVKIDRSKIPPIPLNYIKYNKTYPSRDGFELRYTDDYFVSQLQRQFPAIDQVQQFFAQEFTELQKRYGRQSLRRKYFTHERAQYISWLSWRRPSFDQHFLPLIGERVFNYWWQERIKFDFPLYRSFWSPDPFQKVSCVMPFRRREKESRSLRKYLRKPQGELIMDLHEQFQLAAEICLTVVQREETKLMLANLQICQFYEIFKHRVPSLLPEEEIPFYDKVVQSWKQLAQEWDRREQERQREVEEAEKRRMEEMAQGEGTGSQQLYEQDHKFSIAVFLANLLQRAEQDGISFEGCFSEIEMEVEEQMNEGETDGSIFREMLELNEDYEQTLLGSGRRRELEQQGERETRVEVGGARPRAGKNR